jgi:hypothetical protein
VTLGLDILLLSVDPDLQIVREREYTGYAMRAADLIELAVARRVETRGRWSKWIHVLDARPTGEPLLDASLASLATSRKRVDRTRSGPGWIASPLPETPQTPWTWLIPLRRRSGG